jgi:arylesterase/paraoxonase
MTITRFLFALLALMIGFVFYTMYSTGFFREVRPSAKQIKRSFDLPGVEDLAISKKDSFIILSSDDRAARRDGSKKNGGLYFLDLKNADSAPTLLTKSVNRAFYPHGISLLQLSDTTYRVWAINHPTKKQHQVEVFDLQYGQLTFVETIKDDLLVSPNDLFALDSNRFYITNDHGFTSGLGLLAEDYLGLGASNVIYFDGQRMAEVASGISYANGITYDVSRNYLFVASPRKFTVKVYQTSTDGSLTFIENLNVGTGIDNLHLDEDLSIWTGGHPNLLKFTSYAQGKSKFSPSEVIKITYTGTGDWTQKQLFLDDGQMVSGASAAIPWGDQVFVGNVMDKKLVSFENK